MYTQRTKRPEQSFRPTTRWWTPVIRDADGTPISLQPEAGDAYVVVDEVLEGRVRLVVARWPRLDREGRLHFGDLGRRHGPYTPGTLQALVTATAPATGRCSGRFGWATRSWSGAAPAGWLAGRTWWT
jgi:hypothetical protein